MSPALILVLLGLLHTCTGAPSLVVYAYTSLFSYPGYDFISAFEANASLPAGSVQLVSVGSLDLVNAILNSSVSPVPDVVIGIDNIHQFQLKTNTFLSQNYPAKANIDSHLYGQVSQYNLIPYEYGRVTLIANTTRTGKTDLTDMTLQTLLNSPDLMRRLIIENPDTDATGSAFFMSIVAAFGDPTVGVKGAYAGGNWRNWWKTVLQYATVVPTWDEAWALFAANNSYYMLVSYELDPTYYYCEDGETDIVALELGGESWYLIESLGVFGGSANPTLATQFVNFFLSSTVQTEIPDSEWMFPSVNGIVLPPCFDGISVSPDPEFNEILNYTAVLDNLNMWNSDWQKIYDQSKSSSSQLSVSLVFLLVAAAMFM